jgi:hypothetical protein
MKKLILGLFLIVSSSSYVLANTIEIKNNLDQHDSFKVQYYTQTITQDEMINSEFTGSVEKESNKRILEGCYSQTITQYENSSGAYLYSVAGPRVSRPCSQGQIDGSTSTTYVHQVDPFADLWP